jgi:outer membrane protein assembly factor BamB
MKALYVVEVQTGKQLASYRWSTRHDVNAADPVVIGNKIFISTNYGKGSAMLELQGDGLRLLWQNEQIASHFSSHIYLDGYIYGHDSDVRSSRGNLICVDAETGKIQWAEKMGMISIISVGGKLLILDSKGILHMAEATPEAFEETVSVRVLDRTSWTPPAFANGRIYCRNTTGDIAAIDVGK